MEQHTSLLLQMLQEEDFVSGQIYLKPPTLNEAKSACPSTQPLINHSLKKLSSFRSYTITHICFHEANQKSFSDHHKDIRVLQTGDCVPYSRVSCVTRSEDTMVHCQRFKGTDALLKANFSNMSLTVMLNPLMSQVSIQALDWTDELKGGGL